MYTDLLTQTANFKKNRGKRLQPSATDEQVNNLIINANEVLGIEIPQEYIDFIKITNGFNHNGVFIYPSEKTLYVGRLDRFMAGILDHNLVFRDPDNMKDFLILGEDDLDVYVLKISTGQYEVRDRVPFSNVFYTFNTFDELVCYALQKSLS
ncbi:MAG: YrhA family protein [Proteobacteria bacterium]|nr:YrhA family protein [Pseudomonadota bacterium]